MDLIIRFRIFILLKELVMIVKNNGYLKIDDVLEILQNSSFSIYKTQKNTHILVINCHTDIEILYEPVKDRLPWKTLEGKTLFTCNKVFDSKTDHILDLDSLLWNNGEQIMSYREIINGY